MLSKKADETTSEDSRELVFPQMMGHFLSTLIAWGPTRSLREKIQLLKYTNDHKQMKDGSIDALDRAILIDAEKSLERRLYQTSSGYLQLPSPSIQEHVEPDVPLSTTNPPVDDTLDSLFSVDEILNKVSAHVPLLADGAEFPEAEIANNHAALEAMAELYTMKGRYKMALRCFLVIGSLHISPEVSDVEESAILSVNGAKHRGATTSGQYGFVLAMIEYQHLHQCLLDDRFLASSVSDERKSMPTPLVALMQLVGLHAASEFLVEHCIPPPVSRTPNFPVSPQSRSSIEAKREEKQSGNESLPINLVADQLRPYPKLFHWYLHQIFVNKPEVYVKFPRTAVPPRSVTELHRSHLELYIEYTDKRDSAKALSGIETYNLERTTTPLLSFLKVSYCLDGCLRRAPFRYILIFSFCRLRFLSVAFAQMKLVGCWKQKGSAISKAYNRTWSNILITLQLSWLTSLNASERGLKKTPSRFLICT